MAQSLHNIDLMASGSRVNTENSLCIRRSPTSLSDVQHSKVNLYSQGSNRSLKAGTSGSVNSRDLSLQGLSKPNNLLRTSTSSGHRFATVNTEFDEYYSPRSQNLNTNISTSKSKGTTSVKNAVSWPKSKENDTNITAIKNAKLVKDTKDKPQYKAHVLKDSNKDVRLSYKAKELVPRPRTIGQRKISVAEKIEKTESSPRRGENNVLSGDINRCLRDIFSFGRVLSRPTEESCNMSTTSELSIPEEKVNSDNILSKVFDSRSKETGPGTLKLNLYKKI